MYNYYVLNAIPPPHLISLALIHTQHIFTVRFVLCCSQYTYESTRQFIIDCMLLFQQNIKKVVKKKRHFFPIYINYISVPQRKRTSCSFIYVKDMGSKPGKLKK